jgi:leucyl aminopeptidase
MDIKIRKAPPLQIKTSCMVICACEKDFSNPLLKELDQKLGGLLRKAQRNGEFSAKADEQILFQPAGHLPAERVLLVGLGPAEQTTAEKIRRAAGQAIQLIAEKKFGQMAFALPPGTGGNDYTALVQAATEGLLLASYRYDLFLGGKAKDSRKLPKTATLVIAAEHDKKGCEIAVEKAQKLCRAVVLTRDLVNAPGNIKSPDFLAEQARAAANESRLEVQNPRPERIDQGRLRRPARRRPGQRPRAPADYPGTSWRQERSGAGRPGRQGRYF